MGNVTGNSSFSINILRADFWQVYSCQKSARSVLLQLSSNHEIDILREGSAHSGMAEVGNEVEAFCAQFFVAETLGEEFCRDGHFRIGTSRLTNLLASAIEGREIAPFGMSGNY